MFRATVIMRYIFATRPLADTKDNNNVSHDEMVACRN